MSRSRFAMMGLLTIAAVISMGMMFSSNSEAKATCLSVSRFEISRTTRPIDSGDNAVPRIVASHEGAAEPVETWVLVETHYTWALTIEREVQIPYYTAYGKIPLVDYLPRYFVFVEDAWHEICQH